MKIGILTFHCAHNYGAVLQAYATQKKLISLGYDVEFIEYRPEYLLNPYKIFSLKNLLLSNNPFQIIKNILRVILTLRRRFLRHKQFNNFITQNLRLSPKIYGQIPTNYDVYLFGSDQIWNQKITNGFDKIYFGFFETKQDALKIVYAASMEATKLSDKEIHFLYDALKNFDGISVREPNLINILQGLTDKSIKYVLDPTFIIERHYWDDLAVKPKINQKYVLVYQVRSNNQTLRIAHDIAKQINGVVVELTAWLNIKYIKNRYQCVSPQEFVGWIKYSYCVVTTSFHGTAFSVIFNRPFYTIKLNDGADCRSEFLLNNLHLSNRLIDSNSIIQFTGIDYANANNLLEEFKLNSIDFLNSQLNK